MDKRLLDILCCPVTKSPLRPLSRAQLDVLNRAIDSGSVRTINNLAVSVPLQAGLITVDGKVIYRIEDDIPVMLADESIGTTQLEALPL
jgi:uncharacterized protein YbaR (Trm112 family)